MMKRVLCVAVLLVSANVRAWDDDISRSIDEANDLQRRQNWQQQWQAIEQQRLMQEQNYEMSKMRQAMEDQARERDVQAEIEYQREYRKLVEEEGRKFLERYMKQ